MIIFHKKLFQTETWPMFRARTGGPWGGGGGEQKEISFCDLLPRPEKCRTDIILKTSCQHLDWSI